MSSVVRISEAASLGLHTAVLLAANPGRRLTTHEIAAQLGASEDHLAKVLHNLVRAGIVESARGPKGGFQLSTNGGLTLLDVYEAIEGRLDDLVCLLGTPVCRGDMCILGGLLSRINQEARTYLAATKLSELTEVYQHK